MAQIPGQPCGLQVAAEAAAAEAAAAQACAAAAAEHSNEALHSAIAELKRQVGCAISSLLPGPQTAVFGC